MKIIDGQLFKEMMISGTNNLFNHYPEIDALNVFPVPDGDTGMNMNLTLSSGAKEIANRNDTNIADMAKAFSRGLLMGARGNSGVITSQIFRGFAKGVEGKETLDAIAFAEALVNGTAVAYKAVMKPVEGTILTVIRESSDTLVNKIKDGDSIEKAFEILIKAAKVSLAHTPELLPVLKEVGVVDSGGAGLIKIFEGMESALKGKMVEKKALSEIEASINGDAEEGYCLEFVLNLGGEDKKVFNEKRFESALAKYGAVKDFKANSEELYLHIHTGVPGNLINFVLSYGEFSKIKFENMKEGHTESNFELKGDVEDNSPLKDFGIIAVSAGKGLDEFFKETGVNYIVSGGQTMNPSTEDFVAAIKKVHAKNVFILPNNSNIILAASQACQVYKDDEVKARVIETKTIPQGLVAAMSFNSEEDADTNFENMNAAIEMVKSGSVTYAIRDTDIDGVHVTKDYYMGMVGKQILSCEKDKFKTLFKLLEQMIDEDSAIITIIVGEDIKDEEMDYIQAKLASKHPDIDLDVRRGDQPVYSFFVGIE